MDQETPKKRRLFEDSPPPQEDGPVEVESSSPMSAMQKLLAVGTVVIVVILAAVVSRDFWLPAAQQYWTAHIHHAQTTAAAQILPNTNLDSLDDIFSLAGNAYYLYSIEKINAGWTAYYSPSLDQDPDNADSSVSIGYYLPSSTNPVPAEDIASFDEQAFQEKGAITVQPYSFPDPDYEGQSIYVIPMYTVDLKNKWGQVIIIIVKQDNNKAFSVAFTQNVQGNTTAEITTAAKNWLYNNMQTYIPALTKTEAGDLWFEK